MASRAAQSNSVYVSVLKISIADADCASKSLCQKFFSRKRPLLAWGKILLYFATTMDRNRDSTHQSQNEDNFSWARVLKWGRKREKQRNRRLGIGAITIRFTVRGWNAILTERHSGKTKQVTNSSVSSFKGKLKVIPLKLFYYQTFFETWRNEHSWYEHYKNAIKIWGHRACLRVSRLLKWGIFTGCALKVWITFIQN